MKNYELHTAVPVYRSHHCLASIGTEFESGGAGLLSTVSDYSLFLKMLTNRGTSPEGVCILSTASVDLMRTDHLTEKTRSDYNWEHHAGYGYGLGVRTHISKAGSGSLSPLGEFGWSGAAGCFRDHRSRIAVDRHVCAAFGEQSGAIRTSSIKKHRLLVPVIRKPDSPWQYVSKER
ncbi:hypothetical protein PALU110988_30145 [Paenibacillus lupini]|uniref:hypothetical protein n=1 Tax=Paenibacillus lupini TaxID=1450204 RepID=UPI001FB87CDA|nr:hypothetical protein [Paenibacillus lupini]NIK24160.1 hypothetical protein [Paenibacillus lupini]